MRVKVFSKVKYSILSNRQESGSKSVGAIAKWLRRQIRNLFLFEGVGSNPAGVVNL